MARSLQGGGRPSHHRVPAAGSAGSKTHTASPHRPWVALGPEVAPRAGSARHATQEPAHRAQAGGSSSKGQIRRRLAAQRPRAPRASRDPEFSAADTKGDRVSTYLVAKKTYFGRQNDSSRQQGPSMTRREGPRNLDPATCSQHYPTNTRPGALGGHLVDFWGGGGGGGRGREGAAWWWQKWGRGRQGRGSWPETPPRFAHTRRRYRSVRVSERGVGFDVHKEKRKNRQRGASNKTSGPRRGTTPGAQTVLHGAPRTARAGPHPPPD